MTAVLTDPHVSLEQMRQLHGLFEGSNIPGTLYDDLQKLLYGKDPARRMCVITNEDIVVGAAIKSAEETWIAGEVPDEVVNALRSVLLPTSH